MQSIFHLFHRLPALARHRAGLLAIAGALLCPVSQAAPAAAGTYTLFKNANIVDMEDGKKADFVRLAKNGYKAALLDPSKISAIKVIGTYLDGTPVDYFPTAQ